MPTIEGDDKALSLPYTSMIRFNAKFPNQE